MAAPFRAPLATPDASSFLTLNRTHASQSGYKSLEDGKAHAPIHASWHPDCEMNICKQGGKKPLLWWAGICYCSYLYYAYSCLFKSMQLLTNKFKHHETSFIAYNFLQLLKKKNVM